MSKKETTYVVDIASIDGVSKETADDLQTSSTFGNQDWLIGQVKKGHIYICNIVEEDDFERRQR